HLRGHRPVDLRDRAGCDVADRAAAVAVAGRADPLPDLRRAPAHAVPELDDPGLEIDDVHAIVLAAGVEAVDRRPRLPAVRILFDLDDERPVDHGAVDERVLLIRVARARAEELRQRARGLLRLGGVRADPDHASDAAAVLAKRAQPEEDFRRLLVVLELRRQVAGAREVEVGRREVADVRQLLRELQADDALLREPARRIAGELQRLVHWLAALDPSGRDLPRERRAPARRREADA